MEITASLVNELRKKTGAGMMQCKKALKETSGDIEKAVVFLKEKGLMDASKRSDRATREGVVSLAISNDNKNGILVEVNCETDFVGKNENFQKMGNDIAKEILGDSSVNDGKSATEKYEGKLKEIIASFKENTTFGNIKRVNIDGTGLVESYIHAGSKVAVICGFKFEKEDTKNNDSFKELVKDVCMHIAAVSPIALTSDFVDKKVIAEQEEIFKKQLLEEGKPENIIDNIVKGKINKYFQEVVLLEQAFVKENKLSIKQLLADKSKEIDDSITISNFARIGVGEEG